MKNYRALQTLQRAALVVSLLLLGVQSLMAAGEIQVPLIKTSTEEYQNVKVFNRTASHLSFSYEHGTAVIKLSDIDPDSLAAIERAQAGLPEPIPGMPVETTTVATTKAPLTFNWETITKLASSKLTADSLPPGITMVWVWRFLGVLAGLWFGFSLCCSLICKKAGQPGGLLVWLPVFQVIPLFRAAGMSGWWFLAQFIPLLNLVAFVLWAVKISQARGKGFLTAVFLILPVTNIFAFLYLAFSNGHAKAEEFTPVRPPHALALG